MSHYNKDNKPSKKEKEKLLEDIRAKFSECEDFYSRDYRRNREDTNFALGDQWEEKVRKDRQRFKQPCLTVNRLLPFALKTVNDIRKARPTITCRPVDDEGDIETAEIYSGLIRNIQYTSSAESDYDTSSLNAIISARGFIKVGTKYASHDSFDQEIDIGCVKDPFKAYLDPASEEMDGSDADYFIEFDSMDKEEFKRTFPKAKTEDLENKSDGWFTDSRIRVIDYWYKEYETKTLYQYIDDGKKVATLDKREGEEPELTRQTSICSIKHCRATGKEILQQNDVIGQLLPVVPVYGLVVYKDSKREVYSLIHQAKDPQRMYNYWKSASAEIVALQPKAPWVGYKGSFKNNPEEWARANIENIPFLEAEPVEMPNGMLAPLPVRQPPPQGSAIMVQEGMLSADDIKAAIGVYSPSLGEQSNEVSGVAIQGRQSQGDNATYHFVDNLVTSMRQVGKIMVDMIPAIYNEQRVMRILGEDGESNLVGVNQPVIKQGKDRIPVQGYKGEYEEDKVEQYDLDIGKYDVVVDIGASYATRRQETFDLLKELMRTLPQVAEAAPDLLIKSFDVQYAKEIADRVRANMDPSLLGDDVESERIKSLSNKLQEALERLEQTELALQVKDDNAEFKNAIAKREVTIKEEELKNDTIKIKAEVRKMDAETSVAIPAEASKDTAESFEKLQGEVADVIKAVELIFDNEDNKRLSDKL